MVLAYPFVSCRKRYTNILYFMNSTSGVMSVNIYNLSQGVPKHLIDQDLT